LCLWCVVRDNAFCACDLQEGAVCACGVLCVTMLFVLVSCRRVLSTSVMFTKVLLACGVHEGAIVSVLRTRLLLACGVNDNDAVCAGSAHEGAVCICDAHFI